MKLNNREKLIVILIIVISALFLVNYYQKTIRDLIICLILSKKI